MTLDFFKAYDRVFLKFLIQVMEKMNFGTVFTSWIAMLHEGAMTRFIISGLTSTSNAMKHQLKILFPKCTATTLYVTSDYIRPGAGIRELVLPLF